MPGPHFGKVWNNENCYRYAINHVGSAADPGNGSWIVNGVVDPIRLRTAITDEGHIHINVINPPAINNRPNWHLIAVKSDTRNLNYHVLRRDESTGIWYQKTPATAAGAVWGTGVAGLRNPRTVNWAPTQTLANTGMLQVWVGFFWARDVYQAPNNCLIM